MTHTSVDNDYIAEDAILGEGEVAEVAVLLPAIQAAALERAAHRRGVTAGQLFRRLIEEFLRDRDHAADSLPADESP